MDKNMDKNIDKNMNADMRKVEMRKVNEKVQEEVKLILDHTFTNKDLSKIKVSGPHNVDGQLLSVVIKLVELKKGLCFQFVYENRTNNITKNYDLSESKSELVTLLNGFSFISIITHTHIYQYDPKSKKLKRRTNKNNATLKKNKATAQKALQHDKSKNYKVNATSPYLTALGITSSEGHVRKDKNDKLKQINRYIELVAPLIASAGLSQAYSVSDMGSGKGYLTFALYDYLKNTLGHSPKIVGVEIREGLVKDCNERASQLGFNGLSFVEGYISAYEVSQLDVLIALHACDTATDEAIAAGINASAKLIVCSPCCHKQIRKAMKTSVPMNAITKYGIMKERQAELITDTIRALVLEYYGYKTKVIEFVKTAHTPKNLLVVGVKHSDKLNPAKLEEIQKLKQVFGIADHHLEKILSLS